MVLLERGYSLQKFFPAEQSGGAPYLSALVSPLPQVKFCPTGGITSENAPHYLQLANGRTVGGSWMAPADWIAAKAFDRIRDETARAVSVARGDAEAPRSPAGASRS